MARKRIVRIVAKRNDGPQRLAIDVMRELGLTEHQIKMRQLNYQLKHLACE